MTAGIPWREIGEMTVEDIALAAQVRQEQNKEFAQTLAWVIYNGAALTGVAINNPRKFPKIEDAFPSLFEQKEQQDWRVMKERVENYMNAKKKRHDEHKRQA